MAKRQNWKGIKEFSLEEISSPIRGKWANLYLNIYESLVLTDLPKGVAVEFDDLFEAKRAAVSIMKLFRENIGKGAVRTSVRIYEGKPSLLVWRGEGWDAATK